MRPVLQRLSLFSCFPFTSPAGNKSAQFVSNWYPWMLMLCPWETTLLCSTRELQNPTTNQCIKGSLEHWTLGSFVKLTQHACMSKSTSAQTKTIHYIICLAVSESVNFKTHNQWGLFKVLQMFTLNVQFLVRVLCFQGRQQQQQELISMVYSLKILSSGFSLSCSPCQYVTEQTLFATVT